MIEANINVQTLFAVPLAVVRFSGAEALNDQLKGLFLEREKAGEEYRSRKHADTQRGDIFESRLNLFSWPDEPVKELAGHCHDALVRLVASLNQYDDKHLEQLNFEYHSWFHITRAGGYQGLHNHPNASWSGIYCIDPGDDDPDRPDSGMVRFHDPRSGVAMYLDLGNRDLAAPYFMGTLNVCHEAGKLLLFPSYLTHEVFAYIGQRPRIVVAFNCWLRPERS